MGNMKVSLRLVTVLKWLRDGDKFEMLVTKFLNWPLFRSIGDFYVGYFLSYICDFSNVLNRLTTSDFGHRIQHLSPTSMLP